MSNLTNHSTHKMIQKFFTQTVGSSSGSGDQEGGGPTLKSASGRKGALQVLRHMVNKKV